MLLTSARKFAMIQKQLIYMIKKLLEKFGNSLQEISDWRDRVLFLFIEPCWPRKITPNHITYIRVIIGILLFIFLFFLDIKDKFLIIFLFFIGVVTDLFDGSVARGLNEVTEFGAMLDSTADRILLFPIAFYSLYYSQKWLLLLLLLAEIINAIASIFYKSKEIYLESNIFGKTKMVLLCIVFIVILIVWPDEPPLFFIDILWASLFFSFLSIFSKVLDLNSKGHIKNKIIKK